MNILIVRTFGSRIDATSYNVQEIGLAKAWVRAGHNADVVLYGGLSDDRTVLMPVDDTGIVRYDEKLLGDDAYVTEGSVATDTDRFISVYYLGGISILKNAFFFSLKGLCRNYDIIQVHEYDQITSWLYYTNRKLKDKVVIYHGPYFHEFNRGYNLKCRIFDNTFMRLRTAPYVNCYAKSNAAAEFLRSKGFRNVYPVGVGLDTDAWEDIQTEVRRSSAHDFFTYIYIGKLEPRRNTIFLTDVVDRILSAHDDTRFIMIGDGETEYKGRCLAKLKKWKASGRVTYISEVRQDELPAMYSEADCMLFPTIYDIFGMVLMEAIYFGLPVITSHNGGADMLFEDGKNAIVTDDLTLATWADAAERMYGDVALRNRIKIALLDDREKISWDNTVRRMLATWPGTASVRTEQ